MIPYIIFVILLIIFWYWNKPNMMFIIIVAFALLRYDTGWDYASYCSVLPMFSKFHPEYTRFSLPWQALFVLANKLDFPHLVFIVPNLLTYLLVYFSCRIYFRSDQRSFSNALLFYALWPFFYLASWSTIRQMLAVSFGLFGLVQLFERRYWLCALLYYFAYLAHPSSLVLILFVPVYLFRKYFNLKLILIVSACAVIIFGSLASVMSWLAVDEFSRYEVYFKTSNSFGGKLVFVHAALFLWLCYAFYHNYRNKWAKNDFYKACLGLSIIAMACEIGMFCVSTTNIFARIIIYFSIPMMLVIYRTFTGIKSGALLRKIFTICLVLLFFTYLKISTGKGSEKASSPFVPYQCILFK